MSPKRLRIITGASTRFGGGGAPCPLDYYAVRDPSLVRVIPVQRPPLPNGFRHVRLSLKLDPAERLPETAAAIRQRADPAELEGTMAFLMTIGLPLGEEDRFHRRAVGTESNQDFTDLYTRIREMCTEES